MTDIKVVEPDVVEAEPQPETILYFLHDNGSVSKLVSTAPPDEVARPDNAVEIAEDEHAERLEEIQAVNAAALEELLSTERQQQLDDYEALLALRVPEATARRLTGYVPEGD